MQPFLIQSNNVIDNLIGGYPSKQVTTIYGNAATGKTTSCLLASIEAAKNSKVIFIDTELGFNVDRIRQLYDGNIEKIMQNIFLLQPKTFEEQYDLILKTKSLCKSEKIKLVVIDTIGSLYRKFVADNHVQYNGMLLTQMKTLVHIARDMNKAVLMTNQVYAKMDAKDEIKMIGGAITEKISKCIIEFHKIEDKRYATLKKLRTDYENTTHYNLGKKIVFEIKEKGLFPLENK